MARTPLGPKLRGVVLRATFALGVVASVGPLLATAAPSPSTAARAASPALAAPVHEIPVSATVQIYVRPEGNVLRMLVRTPLGTMRDFLFPTRGPGFLNISEAAPMLVEAAYLWVLDYVTVYEGDSVLSDGEVVRTRVSLPSDRSFGSYETALANVMAPPLPDETEVAWQQAMLDVLIEYPIESDLSDFSIDSELGHLGLTTYTILRFTLPDDDERLFQWTGSPGLIRLDPSWFQAAAGFVRMGFLHILDGIDHLLFVFCLVIPFRKLVPLFAIVTSFTVAHSITLIASALGFAPEALWFPPLIETLIAVSILFMAFENIAGAKVERRWLIAFIFGLVHGFGFSFALRESLQLAGSHLLTSLFAFNVGVELGQIGVLLLAVPALGLLFRYAIAERVGVILLSGLIAHVAWHWSAERWGTFREYPLQLPPFDVLFLLDVIRFLTATLILVGVLWGWHAILERFKGLG